MREHGQESNVSLCDINMRTLANLRHELVKLELWECTIMELEVMYNYHEKWWEQEYLGDQGRKGKLHPQYPSWAFIGQVVLYHSYLGMVAIINGSILVMGGMPNSLNCIYLGWMMEFVGLGMQSWYVESLLRPSSPSFSSIISWFNFLPYSSVSISNWHALISYWSIQPPLSCLNFFHCCFTLLLSI